MKIKGLKDTIDWYNKNADQYRQASDSAFSVHDEEQLDQFEKLLFKGAKILDVGCGSGRDTNLLAKEGLETIGLDLSFGLIKIARKIHPELEFVEGNMLSLPFPSFSFDGLWCHASLLHLETEDDVKKALKEFYRVLKSDGILHVLVKAQIGKSKTAVVFDSLSKHNRFFQYFTKSEMENLLKELGFNLISIRQYNETEKNPKGRNEVEWIVILARKK